MKELEEIHQKLLILYFDCDEYVDHPTLKSSVDEIIILTEEFKTKIEDINNIKHKMI